jgi:hypothetical protein
MPAVPLSVQVTYLRMWTRVPWFPQEAERGGTVAKRDLYPVRRKRRCPLIPLAAPIQKLWKAIQTTPLWMRLLGPDRSVGRGGTPQGSPTVPERLWGARGTL